MDDPCDSDDKSALQSNLNTTMTISAPDVVSSCEVSASALDSFGILDQGEMEDFSLVPDSEEKQGSKMETNRNIDETFDASPFPPRLIELSRNTTMVLTKADFPSSSKQTPNHFLPDSTPCHSTPLNDLSDCLEMVAPLVDDIDHHDGARDVVDLEVSTDVDFLISRSSQLLEAEAILFKVSGSDNVPVSSSKTEPLELNDAKPSLKPKPSHSAKQSASQSKVSKPKLPSAVLLGKQVGAKQSHLSLNPKLAPKEMLLSRRSSALIGNTPKTKTPLLKIALSRPSSSISKPSTSTTKPSSSISKPSMKPPSQVPKSMLPPTLVKQAPSTLTAGRPTTNPTRSVLKVQRSESTLSTSSSKSNISSNSNTSGSSSSARNRQVNPPKSRSVLPTRTGERKITGAGLKQETSNANKPTSMSTGGHLSLDTDSSKNPPEMKSARKTLQKSVSSLSSTSSVPKLYTRSTGQKADTNLLGNVSNNNIPKSNSSKSGLGARPKTGSNIYQKTSANLPKTVIKPTKSPSKSSGIVKSSSSVKAQPKLPSSNSFIAQEVTTKPSLPPRSLSNVTSAVQQSSSTTKNLTRKTSESTGRTGGSSPRVAPSRLLRVPSSHRSTTSSQPDLVKTTTPRPDLEIEIAKAKSCLATKSAELNQAKIVTTDNTLGFDALAIVLKNLLDRTEQQAETLKHDVDAWKSRYQYLQLEMENLKQKHKVAEEDFNQVLFQLGKDIETMCRKHEEEKDTMKEANRCQIEAQRLEIQEEMRKRKSKNENDTALLREEHQVELLRKEKSNELSLANEKNMFEMRENEIRKSSEIEKEELKQTIQQLESKVSALVINLMNGPDHRDGAMAEMQKEIDSLRAVVEMRNDDIKSVNEENRRLCQKMSTFKEMKVNVRNLSSQVEDMKELLTAKRTNERKLDAELQQLQESMQKTSREKRRLSIEKEQLEWRINKF